MFSTRLVNFIDYVNYAILKEIDKKYKKYCDFKIDQKYFCPNCFDNKVLKEVMTLKYKCSNCYSCPSCKNLLMIRASTAKNKELLAAASSASIVQQDDGKSSTSATTMQSDINAVQTPTVLMVSGQTSQQPQQPHIPKVFYLMCGFCRWSTRDAGIPDALSSLLFAK